MCLRHVSLPWKVQKYLGLPNDYIIFYHLNHHKLMGSVCRKRNNKKNEREKLMFSPQPFSVHLNLKCFYVHLLVFTTKYVQIIHWNVFIIWNRMKWLNIFHFKRKSVWVLLSLPVLFRDGLNYPSFRDMGFLKFHSTDASVAVTYNNPTQLLEYLYSPMCLLKWA